MTKKSSTIKKKLKEMLDDNAFEYLQNFQSADSWQEMSEDEKELLANIFVKHGELQLGKGDRNVLDSFATAKILAPKNAKIFFKQGMAYASQEHNTYCLKSACEVLQKATELAPSFFEAWHVWGNVLVKLGNLTGDSDYHFRADKVFAEAEVSSHKISGLRAAEYYHHWGVCWYLIGKKSGETCDYHKSVNYLKRAAKHGRANAFFWNDFGNVYIALGYLLNRESCIFEAIECYWKAVKIDGKYAQGWLNLALSFQRLYNINKKDAYFNLANECYEQVAKFDMENSYLWIRWAELLSFTGKETNDPAKFKASIEKYEFADFCDSNNSEILTRWAEVEILYGAKTEDLNYLNSAQKHLATAIEIQPDEIFSWYLLGSCINELGFYFNDESYFHQAIEKFQYGLSLNSNSFNLWYGLALATYSVGSLRFDLKIIEHGCRLFARAEEKEGNVVPYFWNDWGIALMKLGELTGERQHIKAAIHKYENLIYGRDGELVDPIWLYNYGCALDFLGDLTDDVEAYEKAAKIFIKVLQMDPTLIKTYYHLAITLTNLGEITQDVECFEKAIEQYQTYLQLEAEDPAGWNEYAIALIHLASTLDEMIHYDRVEALFQRAEMSLKQSVALGSTHAYYNLACIYAMSLQESLAIFYLEKAKSFGALPTIDDLLHDEWLKELHQSPAFHTFVETLRKESTDPFID